jgi:valine dehydrogenase (NAD+)
VDVRGEPAVSTPPTGVRLRGRCGPHRCSFDRAEARAGGIFDVALRVFRAADEDGVSPAVAADRHAEERIASVGRLATIRLPR